MLISRYPLSNRRYIEIIADIFRVMDDIFEKSLIY
ncbi:PadR family transcriptional regulator, partial [Bacillus cereus]